MDATQESSAWQPDEEALTRVPGTIASIYGVLPLSYKDGVLTIVATKESGLGAAADIEQFLGLQKPIAVVHGTRDAIRAAIDHHYEPGVELLNEGDIIGFDPSPDWE